MILNGERIKEARKQQNLSRAELSRRLGVDVKTVYNAEAGRNVNADTLAGIASALGLSIDSLFDRDPGPVA